MHVVMMKIAMCGIIEDEGGVIAICPGLCYLWGGAE